MGYVAYQQPDGKWCIWGTHTDDFVEEDMTRKEVREFYLERERERIETMLDEVEAGERVRRHSYEDVLERREQLSDQHEAGK